MEVEAENGQICLPKQIQDRFGERFELVDRGEDLLLVPLPENPLDALRKEWCEIDQSVRELKRAANEQAEHDAGDRSRELVVELYLDDVIGFEMLAEFVSRHDAEAARASKQILDQGEELVDELLE